MSQRTIRLTIAALGGQGGGVLSDWLVATAESAGYFVQSTSVPGVAQRTGATIYYLEFCPRAAAGAAGCEPVMALMPVAGDVDCVAAAELVEAGRMMLRGLVSPDRTTLLASSHRDYTIAERSAPGRGPSDSGALLAIARTRARRLIAFDMAAIAARHGSVISAALFGAIGGSGVLPFDRRQFEDAIRASGLSVAGNLAAFAEAWALAAAGTVAEGSATAGGRAPAPPVESVPAALRERLGALPAELQSVATAGICRLLDYQDPAYAALYLDRLERILPLARRHGSGSLALAGVVARQLALWMSYQDTIRVAELKTSLARFARLRREVRAEPAQVLRVTDFLRPRVTDLADTLPAAAGERLLRMPRLVRWLARATGGHRVRTDTVTGFLLLRGIAALRCWRRGTRRFREENARIESWLARIGQIAPRNHALAVEVALLQRLVCGYGDTQENGWRHYSALLAAADELAGRTDGAVRMRRLFEAAFGAASDAALERELRGLASAGGPPAA